MSDAVMRVEKPRRMVPKGSLGVAKPPAGATKDDESWRPEMVWIRQSGRNSLDALRSAGERTMSRYDDFEWWDELYEAAATAGPLLFDEPMRSDRFPGTQVLDLGSSVRAAVWRRGQTYMVFVLGSIAARNTKTNLLEEQHENLVMQLFAELLEEIRPFAVYTSSFDRIVRRVRYSVDSLKMLENGEVRYLYFQDDELDLGDPNVEQDFGVLAKIAHDSFLRGNRGMRGGRYSAIRRNVWVNGAQSVPLGFRQDQSQRLVVNEDETPIVEAICELLDLDDSVTSVTRALIERGVDVPRRRTRQQGRKRGRSTKVDEERALFDRVYRTVNNFYAVLPDLAVGKRVTVENQPTSFDMTHGGFRQVELDGGRYCHRVVYNVPDLFAGVSETMLRRVVRSAIQRNLRNGRPGSEWEAEVSARAKVAAEMAMPDRRHGKRVSRANRAWAGEGGRLLSAVGGDGVLPGREWVAGLVAELEGGAQAVTQPTRGKRLYAYFPQRAWVDSGAEWAVMHRLRYYLLVRREVDTTVSATDSLLRGWLGESRECLHEGAIVAEVRDSDLHRSVAAGVLQALVTGVPALNASSEIVSAIPGTQQAEVVTTDARERTLEAQLAAAEDWLHQATAAYQDAFGRSRGSSSASSIKALLDVLFADLDVATQRTQAAAETLAAFRQERLRTAAGNPVVNRPDESDLTVVAKVLAYVASRARDNKEVVDLVRTVLTDLSLSVVDDETVEVQVTVRVPIARSDAWASYGPIRVIVPVATSTAPRLLPAPIANSGLAAARRVLLRGDDSDLTPVLSGTSPTLNNKDVERTSEFLEGKGVGRARVIALIACPLRVVRETAWRLIVDGQVPNGEYETAIADGYYRKGEKGGKDKMWITFKPRRQHALDVLAAHNAPMTTYSLADLVGPDSGVTDRTAEIRKWYNQPNSGLSLLVRVNEHTNNRVRSQVRARPCPHCAPGSGAFLDLEIRALEVPSGLICSTCRRASDSPTLIYDQSYVTVVRQLMTLARASTPTILPSAS